MAENKTSDSQKKEGFKNNERYRIPDVLDYKNIRGFDNTKNKINDRNTDIDNKDKAKRKNNRKKSNYRILYTLYGASFAIALIVILVLVVDFIGKEADKHSDGINLPTYTPTDKLQYVSINAKSFTTVLGEEYNLTLSANPSSLLQVAFWESDNSDVVTVNDTGHIVAVGVGVATVTVTAREFKDSIAIEVIEKSGDGSNLGLPEYDGDLSQQVKPGQTSEWNDNNGNNDILTSQDNHEEQSQQNHQSTGENNSINETESQKKPERETQSQPETGSERETESHQETGNEKETKPKPQEKPTHSVSEDDEQMTTEPTMVESLSIDVPDMLSVLFEAGFTPYLTNTCIYYENNEYFGQIIVQNDSVHIYIKKESDNFTASIKEALKYLMPESYQKAWEKVLTTKENNTFSVDGRKIRVILPQVDAHKQIIIF